jgi:glycosyltransferase involved in cell wall biosynthesis
MAVFWADEIISDNLLVQKFFREKYGRETPLVGYGADLEKPTTKTALEEFGLKPSKYILQVAAIVPDKGVHTLVEAYEKLETDLPLVIVGDTPYMTKYKAQVLSTKDRRIKFLGYIYGTRYRELLANCYMYIHPLLADGTSPALLQAMAYGCCVIASDLPEMGWSLSNCGPKFPPGDVGALRQQIAYLLENPEETKKYGNMARQRILDNFTWERITDQYEELSQKLLHQN